MDLASIFCKRNVPKFLPLFKLPYEVQLQFKQKRLKDSLICFQNKIATRKFLPPELANQINEQTERRTHPFNVSDVSHASIIEGFKPNSIAWIGFGFSGKLCVGRFVYTALSKIPQIYEISRDFKDEKPMHLNVLKLLQNYLQNCRALAKFPFSSVSEAFDLPNIILKSNSKNELLINFQTPYTNNTTNNNNRNHYQKNIIKHNFMNADWLEEFRQEICAEFVPLFYHHQLVGEEETVHLKSVHIDRLGCVWGAPLLLEELAQPHKFVIMPYNPLHNFNIQSVQTLASQIRGELRAANQKSSRFMLELFCGAGELSVMLADEFGRILGVDHRKRAIEEANQNLQLNDLEASKVRFELSSLAKIPDRLKKLCDDESKKEKKKSEKVTENAYDAENEQDDEEENGFDSVCAIVHQSENLTTKMVETLRRIKRLNQVMFVAPDFTEGRAMDILIRFCLLPTSAMFLRPFRIDRIIPIDAEPFKKKLLLLFVLRRDCK